MRYRNIQFAFFRLLAGQLRALLALVWFALLFVPPAFARTSLDLDERFQPIALLDWGDSWIDPTGRKSIKDVSALAQNAFVPTGQARRSKSVDSSKAKG